MILNIIVCFFLQLGAQADSIHEDIIAIFALPQVILKARQVAWMVPVSNCVFPSGCLIDCCRHLLCPPNLEDLRMQNRNLPHN